MIEERIWFSDQKRNVDKPIPSNKILIMLPFWEGDREQHIKQVRLLADLEPGHSEYADLLFVPRFDCSADPATITYASRKFNIHTHLSKKRETGWPRGCNSIFFSALEWAYHKMAAKKAPAYKALFIMGADTAPMNRQWIPLLSNTWDVVNSRHHVCVAGALLPAGPHGHAHINGDCMLLSGDLKFLKWLAVTVGRVDVAAGWDWVLAGEFSKRGWANISFIRSIWRKDGFSEADWDAETRLGTILYHGCKNNDLIEMGRRKLL